MTTKKIYTDIHRFSAKETPTEISYDKNSVFLGDLWDVHCLHKDSLAMKYASDKHRHKCDMTTGVINVRGNHEGLYGFGMVEYVIEDGVMYCHSHTAFYSPKQKAKWYAKDAGISRWKFYGIKVTNLFRNMKGNKVSEKKLQIIAKYAIAIGKIENESIYTIVVGHLHKEHDGMVGVMIEDKQGNFDFYQIRVIVANCGLTEINV